MINLVCVAVLLFQRILTSTALPYFESGQWKTVPLKSLTVSGEFYDSLGEVVVKQRWLNEASTPITSKYKFALDENAVVSGYKMRIGEYSWTGVVKAKDTARAEFTAAVSEGVKSSLLEKISDNEYQVEIGPIAPYEHVEVEFRYLTRAPVQMDGSYRFVLPTNIAPKFTSPYTATQADLEYAAKMASVPYVPTSPYSFEVDLLWHSGSALREIQSPTNVIRTDVLSTHSVRVHCSTAPSNGHFALSVRTAETTAAYTHTKEDGTTFLYVHNQIPAEEVVFSSARKITIVLDRSGSMYGGKIVEAVQAIDKFLSLLKVDPNTLLNVVSFGSSFRAVYSNSVPATAENIAQIREIVSHFRADFGGTELLECLKAVTSGEYYYHDHATKKVEHGAKTEHVVVLLTDGQVSNLNAIIQMLEGDKAGTRIMTVGIGRDADRKLVQQVADKTHAICRVLVEEADLTAALTDILSFISKQYFTDMRVLDYEAIQAANVLYPAHPVDMFLKLSPAQFREVQRSGLTITAKDPVHQSTKLWSIGVNECVAAGRSLETLYANLAIAELAKKMDIYEHHNRQQLQRHIVDLSVAHGIMNAFTSFLVISDERVTPNAMRSVREVEVPQVDSSSQSHHQQQHHASRQQFSQPSSRPSTQPTSQPTSQPSAQPSQQPSSQPSAQPSRQPTTQPSAQPSTQPTSRPSSQPSVQPTSVPSVMPSSAPSCQPTAKPSAQPSVIPSAMPSGQPTIIPSGQPSGQPTRQPTMVPLVAPSVKPTGAAVYEGNDQTAKAARVVTPPGVSVKVGADGTVHTAGSLSSVPFTERTLLDLQLADGSLLYTAQSFALLRYASLDLLETDAMAAGLSPSSFFNVAALLRAEQESGFAPGEAARRLRRYVESVVSVDRIVLVAKLIKNL